MAQATRYPASRYTAAPPADLATRDARERLSGPALKAFFSIMTRWSVRDEDARALLGGITNGPFYEMKRTRHITEQDRQQVSQVFETGFTFSDQGVRV